MRAPAPPAQPAAISPPTGAHQPLAPTRTRGTHITRAKNPNWTEDEDAILSQLKARCDKLNWPEVAHLFPSKTQHQVNERWEKVLNPDLVKGSWTGAEDQVIVNWVAEHGIKDWRSLAAQLPGRISKQCRERWHNHLSPNVVKSDWTEEEDNVLIECHAKWGNKWSKIAGALQGRTDNAIKNRWNSSLKRRLERIQNGLDPIVKRGRRPKMPEPRPSMPAVPEHTASPEKATLSVGEPKVDTPPKPESLAFPTFGDQRAPFSPSPFSPFGFWSPIAGVPWSPDLGGKSPADAQVNRTDLANISAPKFDE